jgi:hypothetical protein
MHTTFEKSVEGQKSEDIRRRADFSPTSKNQTGFGAIECIAFNFSAVPLSSRSDRLPPFPFDIKWKNSRQDLVTILRLI